MKHILFIGDAHHQLIFNMVKWLKYEEPEISIDIINTKYNKDKELPSYYNEIFNYSIPEKLNLTPFFGKVAHIRNIKRIIRESPYTYQAVHFHFARTIYNSLIRELRRKTQKIVVTVWGSDFNAASKCTKKRLRKLFNQADIVSLSNETMMAIFLKYYNWENGKNKFKIVKFGLEPLEYLQEKPFVRNECKETLNLPIDRIIISLGYNGSPNQQHIKIISALKNKADLNKWKDKLFFIVPVTYGATKEYLRKVEVAITDLGFPFILYKSFLSEKEIACLRLHTDILIQLQRNDQFSGSMQEHLYAGGVVITGSWLPYTPLSNEGVYFRNINKVENVADELLFVLMNLEQEKEKCKNNKDKIYQISSWKANIDKWIDLY